MTPRPRRRRQPAPAIDLGPDGVAALSRPIIDTEVRTRGHGKVVARSVATEPLDIHLARGRIDEAEHEAGKRVAKSLRTWQRQRVTARLPYASDPGLDDEDEALDDEQRALQRERRYALRRQAEALVGPDCWPDVLAVCGAEPDQWPKHDITRLRAGLARLVVAWKIPRRRGDDDDA